MEEHGKTLAGLHILSGDHTPERLLTRLAENEGVLLDVRDLLIEVVKANRRITPAGEWLLDNFYLIEEQIRAAKRLLPKGYARGLPRLKKARQGTSPCLRHRAGDDFPRRWPGGSGEPPQLCCRLSDGYVAAAGRIMGNSHHAAFGPDREPQACCSTDCH